MFHDVYEGKIFHQLLLFSTTNHFKIGGQRVQVIRIYCTARHATDQHAGQKAERDTRGILQHFTPFKSILWPDRCVIDDSDNGAHANH